MSLLNDAVETYNNIKHKTINKTPVEASNNPKKFRYSFNFKNIKPKLKVSDYVKNADKRNFFSNRYTFNLITDSFKMNQILKSQPPRYRKEDFDG